MARTKFWGIIKDEEGVPVVDCPIRFYLQTSSTPTSADYATIYSTAASASNDEIDQNTFTTNSSGYFEIFVGDSFTPSNRVGYTPDQEFMLKWEKGIRSGLIERIQLFPKVYTVDQTDSSNTVKNKMASNALAYKWSTHVDSTYADEVHQIEPVDITDSTDGTLNKAVTNKLMNELWVRAGEIAVSGIDAITVVTSGALAYEENVADGSWTDEGDGSYSYRVNHNLDLSNYPAVSVYDRDEDEVVLPFKVVPVNKTNVDVYIVETFNANIFVVDFPYNTVVLGFVSGFTYRRLGTIDNSYSSDSINYFPLRVPINKSSGISDTDLREIFDLLQFRTEHAFSGANDDRPDVNMFWDSTDSFDYNEADNYPRIRNNQLYWPSKKDATSWIDVKSLFHVEGDFDIEIEWESDDYWPPTNIGLTPIRFQMFSGSPYDRDTYTTHDEANQEYLYVSISTPASTQIATTGVVPYINVGAGHQDANDVTTDSDSYQGFADLIESGKLRIRRVGTTMTTWIWNTSASRWEWDGDPNGWTASSTITTEPLWMNIYSRSYFTSFGYPDSFINMYFKNLKLNDGRIKWHLNNDPARYKIQFTDISGNKYFSDVEKWDRDNYEAVYNVRIPTLPVSSSSSPTFYMYYDMTAEDTSSYLGASGNTPSHVLWSDYVAAYHLESRPDIRSTNNQESLAIAIEDDFNELDGLDPWPIRWNNKLAHTIQTSGGKLYGSPTNKWLSGFSNRIPITINSARVSSGNLSNFPVALHITSTAGISTQDITTVFDELTFTGDDFTAPDGYQPDAAIWEVSAPFTEILSNQLSYSVSSLDTSIVTESKFSLSGDYSIQVDLNNISGASADRWGFTLTVKNEARTNFYQLQYRQRSSLGGRGITAWRYEGSYTNLGNFSTSVTSCKLRLRRVSTTLYYDYDVGGGWVNLGSETSVNQADHYVELQGISQDTQPTASATFDNFLINSGTVVWGTADNPMARKIAVTTDDGVTQCYVEVERWDETNEEAVLHTKVPSIPSGSDTTLYLYYDADAADNDTYVGSVGTTAAQQVWDSDFYAVYHLSTSTPVDSTSNSRDPNVYNIDSGNIENLIRGKQGIHFNDGVSNEYLQTPFTDTSFIDGDNTIEGIAKFIEDDLIPLADSSESGSTWPTLRLYATDTGRRLSAQMYYSGNNAVRVREDNLTVGADDVAYLGLGHLQSSQIFDGVFGVNGSVEVDDTPTASPGSNLPNENDDYFRCARLKSDGSNEYPDVVVGELRFSNYRNFAWRTATFYTLTDDFVTFGTEEVMGADMDESVFSNYRFKPFADNRLDVGAGFDYHGYDIKIDYGVKGSNSTGTWDLRFGGFESTESSIPTSGGWVIGRRFHPIRGHEVYSAYVSAGNSKLLDEQWTATTSTSGSFRVISTQEYYQSQLYVPEISLYHKTADGSYSLLHKYSTDPDSGGNPGLTDGEHYLQMRWYASGGPKFYGTFDNLKIYNTSATTTNEVSRWVTPFQAIHDLTSNNNHISPSGFSRSDLVDGLKGKAVQFDGTAHQWMDAGNDSSIADVVPMTIEALIYPEKINGDGVILDKSAGNGWTFYTPSAGRLEFDIDFDTQNGKWRTGVNSINPNSWNYVAMTYGGTESDTPLFYVNGSLVDTIITTSASGSRQSDRLSRMYVGSKARTSNFFEGKIEEVRLSSSIKNANYIRNMNESLRDNLINWANNSSIPTDEQYWFKEYYKRMKITIPASEIGSTLTDFPVTVFLPSGSTHGNSFWDQMRGGNNYDKVVITTSGGYAPCYVENERYDQKNRVAVYHFRAPILRSTKDNIFYLYYDKDAEVNSEVVGSVGDRVSSEVWINGYKGVYHMSQDSTGVMSDSSGRYSMTPHGFSTDMRTYHESGLVGTMWPSAASDYSDTFDTNPDPDPEKWTETDPWDKLYTNGAFLLFFNSSKLTYTIYAYLRSTYVLSGDFEIDIRGSHSNWTYPDPGYENISFGLRVYRSSDNVLLGRIDRMENGSLTDGYYREGLDYAGTLSSNGDSNYLMRIKRVGGQITVGYDHSYPYDSPNSLTVTNNDDSDVYVEIYAQQGKDGIVGSNLQYYSINSGNPVKAAWFDSHIDAFHSDEITLEALFTQNKWDNTSSDYDALITKMNASGSSTPSGSEWYLATRQSVDDNYYMEGAVYDETSTKRSLGVLGVNTGGVQLVYGSFVNKNIISTKLNSGTASGSTQYVIDDTDSVIQIGGALLNDPAYHKGSIYEIRVSDVGRGSGWLELTRKSLTNNLITFSSEETYSST